MGFHEWNSCQLPARYEFRWGFDQLLNLTMKNVIISYVVPGTPEFKWNMRVIILKPHQSGTLYILILITVDFTSKVKLKIFKTE